MNSTLAVLGGLFGHGLLLSLLSIGGAITVAPEMQRWLVTEQHWLSDTEFASSIAVAQAAPGPNALFTALVGFHVAGLLGAAALLIGILLPSSALALGISRWGHTRADWRSVRAFKAGMAPITLALIAATGWLLATPPGVGVAPLALTLGAALLAWRTRLHLLWLIGAGALLGALGLV